MPTVSPANVGLQRFRTAAGKWLVLCLFLLAGPWAKAAEQPQLEAAYLVNFLRYTTWPDASPGKPLVIVLLGRPTDVSPIKDALRTAASVQGRPLQIRQVGVPDAVNAKALAALDQQVQGADAVYLRTQDAAWGPWLSRLADRHAVLTVGWGGAFVEQGGMLGLDREGSRLLFAANPHAVTRSGLQVSSKVMQLARNLKARE